MSAASKVQYTLLIYQAYHDKDNLVLNHYLSSPSPIFPELKLEILRLAISQKRFELLEFVDPSEFNSEDLDFTSYDLSEIKRFHQLTEIKPPLYTFYMLMNKGYDENKEFSDILEFYKSNTLDEYYIYLLDNLESNFDRVKELIIEKNFNIELIRKENFYYLVYLTYPNSEIFLTIIEERYGKCFYDGFLDFLIDNLCCQSEIFKFVLSKGARNTIKPNLKEYNALVRDKELLTILESLN